MVVVVVMVVIVVMVVVVMVVVVMVVMCFTLTEVLVTVGTCQNPIAVALIVLPVSYVCTIHHHTISTPRPHNTMRHHTVTQTLVLVAVGVATGALA